MRECIVDCLPFASSRLLHYVLGSVGVHDLESPWYPNPNPTPLAHFPNDFFKVQILTRVARAIWLLGDIVARTCVHQGISKAKRTRAGRILFG